MTNYPPPPPLPPPGQPGPYGGPPLAPGTYFDPASGLALPIGTELAPIGRRVGAFFLAIPLSIITLGIGYLIWGAILWGEGTSPALKLLGMRVYRPAEHRRAGWGHMALRNIVGGIVQSICSLITGLISFILFLTDNQHRTIPDRIATTVVLSDPNKVLG